MYVHVYYIGFNLCIYWKLTRIEALVFFLADLMIVRQGMFFNYEKRRHASKCVIRPILGTSFSANRHIN